MVEYIYKLMNYILKNFNEITSRVGQAGGVLIGKKPLSLEVERVQNIIKIATSYNEFMKILDSNPTLAGAPIIDSFLKKELPKMQEFFRDNTVIYDGEYKLAPPDYTSNLLDSVMKIVMHTPT